MITTLKPIVTQDSYQTPKSIKELVAREEQRMVANRRVVRTRSEIMTSARFDDWAE
jgi:hypothetical protein